MEGYEVNDRAVSLFDQYDVEVKATRKIRGAIIAQTDRGEIALLEYLGSKSHLRFEYAFLEALRKKCDDALDVILVGKDGQLSYTDYEGKRYIAKRHVEGKDVSVFEKEDRILAAECLADYHKKMRGLTLSNLEPITRMVSLATEEEQETLSEQVVVSFEDVDPYEGKPFADDLQGEFLRRTKELIRVRNYIRRLSKKGEFEGRFLQVFDNYLKQANLAMSVLENDCVKRLGMLQQKEKMYVHGDCTQHNILLKKREGRLVCFEHVGAHLQVKDLYLLLRKVLEKNDWDFEIGQSMLSSYQKRLPLSEDELLYLTARFIYPEKFWKVANGYQNTRKSFPVRRQLEKLLSLEEKEPSRQRFLHKWVETYSFRMLY